MKRITLTSNEPTAEEALEQFLNEKELMGLSPVSIDDYQRCCSRFIKYAENPKMSDVSSSAILGYMKQLKEDGLNDVSVNAHISSLRVFMYWCMDKGYTPKFKITLAKVDEVVKETYTNEQLKKLLRKPSPMKSFVELRTWALENFFVGTGARIRTSVNLRICDIDFENSTITYPKNKSRKVQVVPMSKRLGQVLKDYLKVRKGEPNDWLFCSSYGQKISTRTVQKDITDYNLNHGVALTSVHSYRHTFAKLYILNGGDVFRLQKLLGHSNIATTKRYVQMFSDDLATDYDKLNPLDNLQMKGKKINL